MGVVFPACLLVALGIVTFFGEVKSYFARPDQYIREIEKLKSALVHEQKKQIYSEYEFDNFKQEVATLIPEIIKNKSPDYERTYQLRSLASVVQGSANDLQGVTQASALFARAKEDFRLKKFEKSNKSLRTILADHPYFAFAPEVYFLLVEGTFQLREFENCIEAVDKMVELFPENELTGFALLRAGKIYEHQNRFEDAINIYQTLIATFDEPEVDRLAKLALEAVNQ